MPVHDWTRVLAGTFHHFHQAWITALSNALNDGLLPAGYYALAEQVAGSPHPDVLTLEEQSSEPRDVGTPRETALTMETGRGTMLAVAEHPPKVRYTLEAEAAIY